jgi:alpha-galactosidase/6-phospho-beta-glucosidase family protein
VIEIPHRLAPGGMLVRARPVEHIPDHTRELLDALVAYERSAAAAVRARDASRVAAALATHPWVSNDDASELGVAVTASDRNTFR